MKELTAPITRPPGPGIEIPNIQLTTIYDDGRWHNLDGNGRHSNNHHRMDIIWNGTNEKDKIETKKYLVAKYRHGREKLEIKINNNGHETTIRELPKTKRDKQIILDRITAVNNLLESFGYRPSTKRDLNRFHLLKPGDLEIFSKGDIVDGFFDPFGHCMSIERSPSDVETATSVGTRKIT